MQIMDSHVAGMLKMPPEQCKRALAALVEYQQTGARPDFEGDWALDAWWESIEPVLATSRGIAERRAAAGSRGGRARKAQACEGQADGKQSEASDGQAQAKAEQTEANASKPKQAASKRKQTEASGKQTQAEEEEEEEEEVNRERSAPVRGDAGPDPLGERPSPAAYRRPTPSEVEGYVLAAGGHPISGEDFVAWYDDHGWPARGWHGTAMTWSRKRRDEAALGRRPGARAAPDASAFEAYGAAAVSAAEAFGEGEADSVASGD